MIKHRTAKQVCDALHIPPGSIALRSLQAGVTPDMVVIEGKATRMFTRKHFDALARLPAIKKAVAAAERVKA